VDTEVTKLIETLRSISNILEENYGQRTRETASRASIGNQARPEQSRHVPDIVQGTDGQRQEVQATPVYQPVHQLPVASTVGQQLDVTHTNDVSGSAEVVKGTFDNVPVLLQSTTETAIQPEVISDKDRIRQLERELSIMQRQHNDNFNFAPVNIGGANGQSSN
jgi:hypothetical protein